MSERGLYLLLLLSLISEVFFPLSMSLQTTSASVLHPSSHPSSKSFFSLSGVGFPASTTRGSAVLSSFFLDVFCSLREQSTARLLCRCKLLINADFACLSDSGNTISSRLSFLSFTFLFSLFYICSCPPFFVSFSFISPFFSF